MIEMEETTGKWSGDSAATKVVTLKDKSDLKYEKRIYHKFSQF
jgi:hypothetical protein